jgi:hypothetical protein
LWSKKEYNRCSDYLMGILRNPLTKLNDIDKDMLAECKLYEKIDASDHKIFATGLLTFIHNTYIKSRTGITPRKRRLLVKDNHDKYLLKIKITVDVNITELSLITYRDGNFLRPIINYKQIIRDNGYTLEIYKCHLVKFANWRFILLNPQMNWDLKQLCENPTIPTHMAISLLIQYRQTYRGNIDVHKYYMELIANPALQLEMIDDSDINNAYIYSYWPNRSKMFIEKRYGQGYKFVQREIAMRSNICCVMACIVRLAHGQRRHVIRALYTEVLKSLNIDNIDAKLTYYSDLATLKK